MASIASKKQLKEKEKIEQRRRMDEIKSLALRPVITPPFSPARETR